MIITLIVLSFINAYFNEYFDKRQLAPAALSATQQPIARVLLPYCGKLRNMPAKYSFKCVSACTNYAFRNNNSMQRRMTAARNWQCAAFHCISAIADGMLQANEQIIYEDFYIENCVFENNGVIVKNVNSTEYFRNFCSDFFLGSLLKGIISNFTVELQLENIEFCTYKSQFSS